MARAKECFKKLTEFEASNSVVHTNSKFCGFLKIMLWFLYKNKGYLNLSAETKLQILQKRKRA